MTTGAQVDATLARFNRKSPQDAYKQVCEELQIHYQRQIVNQLPDTPSAWHRLRTLDMEDAVLGPKGCMALLPCILVSTSLRRISLENTGLTDQFVLDLCSILQSHPSMRSVNIRNNELVSVFCASAIISVIKQNPNIIAFDAEGTHLGTHVCRIINSLAEDNRKRVANYYEDKYFNLKNLFTYLDTDGKGWVLLKSLVLNCPYPILQEQFVERISKKKPKKRSDNKIQVNTFMSLVYMNYKTEVEIVQRAKQAVDEPYVFMVANWKQIISSAMSYNEENEAKVVLPPDLHRLRIKDLLLTNDEADQILFSAVSYQCSAGREDTETQSSSFNPNYTELSVAALQQATRNCLARIRDSRPKYVFFEERDLSHVPDALMNGSRMLSIRSLPTMMPTGTNSSETMDTSSAIRSPSIASYNSGRATVVADEKDPQRTWQLAPSMVNLILDFFNKTSQKSNIKKSCTIVEKPTGKNDLKDKASIPTHVFLDTVFETDFEYLKPSLLANYFAYYSLPVQDSTITLQEIANVMDEMYTEISVDKIFTNEMIEALENPLEKEEYAEFFGNHLVEREFD